ncbi:zf-CCHC domain-containing protein [Tanacetum coccineum]
MIMEKGLFDPSGGKCGGKFGRGGSMAGSGGDGVVGGEVKGRGVVLGVFKSLLVEIPDDVMGERGGETMGLDGGAVWLVKYLKGMGEGMFGTRSTSKVYLSGIGNSRVKGNKIDLLVQQYEQITILEKETIDSGFARFNTTITSLKALDEGFSSKNYIRKFLRALHPKWRAKVMTIEESKDLSRRAYCVKSIALKAKKESSDDETSTSGSDDEEYAMTVRNFKKFFRRKGRFVRQQREEKKSFQQRDDKKGKNDRQCFRYGDLNHLIGDCPKPPRNKYQKAFVGGCRSNSENEVEDTINDETCLMAQSSNEVTLDFSHYSDNASSFDKDKLRLTISPNVEVFFDLPNVDVLDGCYLDLTLSSPMLKI